MAQIDPRKRTAAGITGGTTTGTALGGPVPAQQSAGVAGPGGAAPSPTGPPQAAQRPNQVGTGFVNLSQVLAANRPGAQQMGAGLVNGVTQKAQKVETDTAGAKATFEKAGDAAVLKYDPTKVPAGYNAATAGYMAAPPPVKPGYGFTEQADYAAWVDSAQPGIDMGKSLSGTKYTGPKTWEDAGVDVKDLTSRAITAQDEAAALGTAGGRQALLSKSVTGPYSAGNRSLDSALLTSAIGGEGQQVAAKYANLSDVLAKARGEAGASFDAKSAATAEAAAKFGADAATLEKTQQGNREQLESADRNRRWTSDSRVGRDGKIVSGGPQSPVLSPLPVAGGGFTVNPIPGPYGLPPESSGSWPAPNAPKEPNYWVGIPRKRSP
jgi:hypothetical protein